MDIKDFYEKYKDTKVHFTRYYKYEFYFGGFGDEGEILLISVGGNAPDIYHMEVEPESNVGSLMMNWDSGEVALVKCGEQIFKGVFSGMSFLR